MDEPRYRERLWAPIRWWALCGAFVASVFVAFAVAAPLGVAVAAAAVLGGLAAGWLIGYGSAQLRVDSDGFAAGRAKLPWSACGQISELGAEQLRALHGRDADARAYLLARPYLHRAVRVNVSDDLDLTPYWLVTTRHPAVLAAAVREERARSLPSQDHKQGMEGWRQVE